MSTVKKPASKHAQIVDMLRQVKIQSSKNDMFGAAIPVSKLRYEFGLEPEETRLSLKKIGCKISLPHIYNHYKLAELPPKVKTYIKTNKIKATKVLGMLHKNQDESELIKLVEKFVANKEKENREKTLKSQLKLTTKKKETFIEFINKKFKQVTGESLNEKKLIKITQELFA